MKKPRTLIPVVCDMSEAPDSPDERVETYRQLFADALVSRDCTADNLRFHFRNGPGIEARVRAVAELEQRCCGFMSFRHNDNGPRGRP
jgi:hypothetical protein